MSFKFRYPISILVGLCAVACGDGAPVATDSIEDSPAQVHPGAVEDLEKQTRLVGQPNFRDLGGYETVDGRRVVSGEIFRSGELSHLTDEDVATLEELGIRTVVNFLIPEEIEKNGADRLPEGVKEVLTPIAGEKAAKQTMIVTAAIKSAEFEKVPPEINPEFHRQLADEGRNEYAALLREAANPESRPLVYHCSHGVHRTGTATAILLSALGVPWETIREEYLLTNHYRRAEVAATLAKIRQMTADSRGIAPEEVDMANVEAFYVLDGTYIDGTHEQAVADFGSIESYIRDGLGITDDEVESLRAQLLK